MNFLFAWRYFKAKKTTNAINIISWISVLAIVIGTVSLILVLSVFNGFEGLVKSLYSSFYPEIKISAATGKQITLSPDQIRQLKSISGVKALSLVVEETAFLQNKNDSSILGESKITIKGVDSNYGAVTSVPDHVVEGVFNTGTQENPMLVLGSGIQNALGVQSDRNIRPLVIYLPRMGDISSSDPLKLLSSELINTSGTFVIQQDFDDKYAITNLAFVKKMLAMPMDAYGAVEISANKNADVALLQQNCKNLLGPGFRVQSRYEQNTSLYSVMRVEKWIIYAILSLILIVAAFNMVGALTMLILEKKQDISVLHALGATGNFILKIFLTEGLLLAFIGGALGMIIAYLIGSIQNKYHLIPLQGSSFMINYFPVKMVVSDFLLVGLTVVIIALLASYLPARKAATHQSLIREE
ncbi:MAG: FtsX-like permease family protein [Flavisolibacter sp.]